MSGVGRWFRSLWWLYRGLCPQCGRKPDVRAVFGPSLTGYPDITIRTRMVCESCGWKTGWK